MDLLSVVANVGSGLWAVLFFVIALSVIVAIHEYGHYIVGKKSGIFPEVFSLGFGKVLWSRVDRDGTKWQIAAIPFGGYVKFRGDANASGGVDSETMQELDEDLKRTTMNGAPLWARSATVAAGPIFNFILTAILFTGVAVFSGAPADPLTVAKLTPMPGIQELREGDQILAVEGVSMPSTDDDGYGAFLTNLPEKTSLTYTVRREGEVLDVQAPHFLPPLVGSVALRSAAKKADLMPGDVVTSMNGAPIATFAQMPDVVENSEGAPVAVELWRDGETIRVLLEPQITDSPLPDGGFEKVYRIGLASALFIEPASERLGLGKAFMSGVNQMERFVTQTLSTPWLMATGQLSTCSISGPVGIAEVSGDMASKGTVNFIWWIGALSLIVGIMNLFPIPVLDGGHLVFYAYEFVSGRPPSEKSLQILMTIGVGLVLSLMAFGLLNDVYRCR